MKARPGLVLREHHRGSGPPRVGGKAPLAHPCEEESLFLAMVARVGESPQELDRRLYIGPIGRRRVLHGVQPLFCSASSA